MAYHFITKITASDLIGSIIGYVNNQTDADYIHNNNDGVAFLSWIDTNITALRSATKTLADFFTENVSITAVYVNYIDANYISVGCGHVDNLITNLDNPEA